MNEDKTCSKCGEEMIEVWIVQTEYYPDNKTLKRDFFEIIEKKWCCGDGDCGYEEKLKDNNKKSKGDING